MPVHLHTADVADLVALQGAAQPGDLRRKSGAGEIAMMGMPLPGMMLADVQWQTGEAVILEDRASSPGISVSFQLSGHMRTQFSGLGHELDMQAGRHNLVFIPEANDTHQMAANAAHRMLSLSIDAAHFRAMIGTESAWCDRALRALDDGRPFSGMQGTGTITPAMQSIIHSICMQPPSGPMRTLLLQARTTELLAMQLEQFIGADSAPAKSALHSEDAHKLHLLKLYLEEHFLEEHTLTSLARRALLNEFKLKKGFKELFGTTIFGHLKDLRMTHAARLLRDHKLRVEEVADLLGYEHAHHFSAAFRQYFGQRPSEL